MLSGENSDSCSKFSFYGVDLNKLNVIVHFLVVRVKIVSSCLWQKVIVPSHGSLILCHEWSLVIVLYII